MYQYCHWIYEYTVCVGISHDMHAYGNHSQGITYSAGGTVMFVIFSLFQWGINYE